MGSARYIQCDRCGYHYTPPQMYLAAKGSWRAWYCVDSARCQRNIERREADRQAVGRG